MGFLIGLGIFFGVGLITYIGIKIKVRSVLNKAGYAGKSLWDIIREAKIEDQQVPKFLPSMDRIYLEQIKEDFPDININELKRKSEEVIMNCYNAIENGNSDDLNGRIKSFVDRKILEYKGKNVKFNNFKIHNTVISDYRRENGVATIYFVSAFEYMLSLNGHEEKTQDRARCEFIYIIDEAEVPEHQSAIDFHCPNCNSPITNLGQKSCSYCGTAVIAVVGRIFACDNIVCY